MKLGATTFSFSVWIGNSNGRPTPYVYVYISGHSSAKITQTKVFFHFNWPAAAQLLLFLLLCVLLHELICSCQWTAESNRNSIETQDAHDTTRQRYSTTQLYILLFPRSTAIARMSPSGLRPQCSVVFTFRLSDDYFCHALVLTFSFFSLSLSLSVSFCLSWQRANRIRFIRVSCVSYIYQTTFMKGHNARDWVFTVYIY